MSAEDVLREKDNGNRQSALDAFRELDIDEKLTAVFADGAIGRYELTLLEGLVAETRRWGKRIVTVVLIALLVLIGLAVGNRSLATRIQECTTPDTPCTDRASTGQVCVVLALENDNRFIHGAPTIPVPKECQP